MDELQTRFKTLDRVPVPNLWADIERRADANPQSSGMSRVSVRTARAISRPEAGTRRSPLGGLVWAALLALLLVAVIAVGGLVAGSWRLDDLRVLLPVPTATPVPTASPAPTATPITSVTFECRVAQGAEGVPELTLNLVDQTGLVTGCQQVAGTLLGSLSPTRPIEITNPADDQALIEVKWAVTNCDLGATLQFTQVGAEYQMHVEVDQE